MTPADTDPKAATAPSGVAAVLLLESGCEHELPQLVQRVREACAEARRAAGGADEALELIVVDRRLAPEPLGLPGAITVHLPSGSRGECWAAGAAAATAEFVVLLENGARPAAGGLRAACRALRAAPEAQAAVGSVAIVDEAGVAQGLVQPFQRCEAPPAGWLEATLWRREALCEMSRAHFFPVELQRYRELAEAGHLIEVETPVAEFPAAAFEAEGEHLRRKGALLSLAARSRTPAPLELSVIVHGSESLQNVERTLASLTRQLVKPGTFEIVVAAQLESGSADAALRRLELIVPQVIVRTTGTPGAVLECALGTARAPLVLFLRAGSVAAHDLVERHLRFHASRGRAALLGGILPPGQGVELALSRHLSTSARGVPRRSLDRGASVPAEQFECSNLSLSRADLAAVGGPDASWACRSNCDIDLGARLAAAGLAITYLPEARVTFADRTIFDALADQRLASWRERARLYLRHPKLLRRSELDRLSVQALAARLQELDAVAIPVQAAAVELGAMDVGSLERLGSEFAAVALEAVDRLEHLLGNLEERWCLQGLTRGLAELDLESLEQLAGVAEAGIPALEGRPGARVLAWPNWSSAAELETLLRAALPLAEVRGAALFLRAHPADSAANRAPELLQRVVAGVFGERAGALPCVCLAGEIRPDQWLRLSAEFSAAIASPHARAEELERVFAIRLSSAEELDAWCGRFDWHGARVAPAPVELDLSVVVPADAEPHLLDALLLCLAAQDLEPDRFEVLVADHGSGEPLESSMTPGQWPFRLALLRAEGAAGAAAARNLALAAAGGRLVLFFDATARPAPDCLRLHVEAHAGLVEPRAVQGATPTHARHRGGALVEYCEQTGLHAGRPTMQPGIVYGGAVLSANNVSVERSHLIAVGGFDSGFSFSAGDDTDLGLRLETALGVKVLYLPALVAQLDRPIEVESFARHQRVLGWSAYRLAVKHDAPSLAFGGAERLDDDLIHGLIADLRGTEPELHQLVEHLARHSHDRPEAGAGAQARAELQPTIERIAFLEYARGLAAAHRERLPFEEDAELAEPQRPAPALPDASLEQTAYTRMVLAHAQRLAEREARDGSRRAAMGLLVELPETLGPDEAGRLYELARRARRGAILALGCGGTRAAVALGGGAIDGCDLRVYAVQPEIAACAESRETFLQTLRDTGCQRAVRLLDLTFDDLARGWGEPIGLLVVGAGVTGESLAALAPHLTAESAVCAIGGAAPPVEAWLTELSRSAGFAAAEPSGELRELRRY